MSFKRTKTTLTFADLEKAIQNKKNRALATMKMIDKTINWSKIENTLMEHYPVGHKKAGNSAYPPLLLFKCLLLKKWNRISSDSELESQINDRESFQAFLHFSITDASPDHSTFSRFRKRLGKDTLNAIITDILNQFSDKGLTINEGVAVDARIVKSASKPMNNKKLNYGLKEQ